MNSGRLLILDDDPAIGQTIRLIAEGCGMEVRFTVEPAEFFDWFEQWDPTHVVLDLVMPDMDGVEVLAELAQRGCASSIIVSSGVGGRVLDAAGRCADEHGLVLTGVLPKPFTPAALRELLARGASRTPSGNSDAARVGFQPRADDVRLALARGELFVVYQPKIVCATKALAGFEALIRWRHPEHGLIAPDRFIPLAERHDLIDELTDQLLDHALAWFGATFPTQPDPDHPDAPAHAPRVALSLNMSARTLRNSDLVERIVERCVGGRIDPRALVFELTETSAMEDPVASLELLTRMRMRGFQLSIDDFGTGFSSMLQLVRLPFSEIKIDKSFVASATRSQESRAVVKSVVDLGHSLGLKATAEGVEDQATFEYLLRIGCDLAQGYWFGRPMSVSEVAEWMAKRRAGVS